MPRFNLLRCAATVAVVTVALLSPAVLPAADVPFNEQTVDSTFGGPTGIYIADFNGDGLNDIVGSAADSSDIAWWENDGGDPIGWTKQTVAASFGGACFVYAEDVDGDLDTDILGAAWARAQIAWWSNEGGDPVVWTKQIVANGYTQAHEVYACDLDKDGDVDILGASAGLGHITWWRNDGGDPIVWTTQTIDSVCPGARSMRPDDFDGDGDMDVASAALVSGDISWYRNDGGDPIVWTEFLVDGAFNMAHMLRIGDMDGDDDPDIVGTSFGFNQIAYYENQGGDPVVWVKRVVTSELGGAQTGYPADIDNDGDMDILGAGYASGDVIWCENEVSAPGGWIKHDLDLEFPGAWPGCADDIDGDGATDLVVAGNHVDRIKLWLNTSLAGVPADGSGDRREVTAVLHFRNSPNPFNPATQISFELDSASEASVAVYDTVGRRVRTLRSGPAAAGVHSVEWDGKNAAGEDVSAGVYFCRIAVAGHVESRSMTLLR